MGQATGFYAGHVKARWGTKEKVPLVSVRALGLQGPDGAYNRIKLVGGALPPHPPPTPPGISAFGAHAKALGQDTTATIHRGIS